MLTPDILLASNSPRRKQLLRLFGWPFSVRPAEIDERPLPGEMPVEYVSRLAQGKAQAAAKSAPDGAIVVAADTTVVDDGIILGKPADADEATAMLRRLRDHTHQVYTAIALVRRQDGLALADLCATEVPMRNYSDPEIAEYVLSGDPLDKAGAYAIQHAGFRPVRQLQGCFANVMGLPLCHLGRSLHQAGVAIPPGIPQACQSTLEYHCPVYHQIFPGMTGG
jgi:septum formation protein